MVTSKDLDIMFEFITKNMKFEKWYPVESDKSYETVLHLFNLGIIPDCEMDTQERHIRKVQLDFSQHTNYPIIYKTSKN